jgi:NAD(P)-dependent dehydrogenase (short-subunit alcohol dehydrogenase family)
MAKTALVTGANQGLGLGFVKRLVEGFAKDDTVYMGVRRMNAGEKALKELGDVPPEVKVIYMDMTDEKSVRDAAGEIKTQHGGIDIVISNAAARISPDIPNAEQVEGFIRTNNGGTTLMMEAFLPLMNKGGSFIVVASAFGSLLHLPAKLHSLFDTESGSLEDIGRVMEEYVADVKNGSAEEKGWPRWINIPSKIGQAALVRIAARNSRDFNLFAFCPGLVDTDASRPFFDNMDQAQSPYDAADPIVRLTAGFQPERNGSLIQYGKILPWK